jgi:hypothetical protein
MLATLDWTLLVLLSARQLVKTSMKKRSVPVTLAWVNAPSNASMMS